MSIQSEITRLSSKISSLETTRTDIITAIRSKGVNVPLDASFNDMAGYIGEIRESFPTSPSLIVLEYFDKHYGEERTGNIHSENVTYDSTCPLQIAGGAPVWSNNQSNDLTYKSDKVKQVCQSNKFTVEFFGKVTQLGSDIYNTSPTCGFQGSGDYWHAVAAPKTNDNTKIDVWINDSQWDGSRDINSMNWNHYEICADGTLSYFFINGNLIRQVNISSVNTYFCIFSKYSSRATISLSQVALWDGPKHKSNFTVNYNPIYYN